MKSKLIIILLSIPFLAFSQKWYNPTKNNLAIFGISILRGGADGQREEVLYHPNNLFKVNPHLNRQYWDQRISWQNRGWAAFKDGNHLCRTTIQLAELLGIGIALLNKKPIKKKLMPVVGSMIYGYLGNKTGFIGRYVIHFKNKLI